MKKWKLETTAFVATLVVLGGFTAFRKGLFTPAPVSAQTNDQVTQCENLRKHGDPGELPCYQKLAQSRDLAIRAEGLWGIRDYQSANDAFRDAVKAREKDANLRVRWGMMYLDHWQPGIASDLFNEALMIDEKNARAYLGQALVFSDAFAGN